MLALCVSACGSRQEQAAGGLMDRSQEDPALSGDGRFLAVISPQRGRPTVQLRSLSDGRLLPLPSLKRHQPHSSPSLSWNGRYLALVTQRGRRRLAVVADRLNNRLHPLPLPGGRDPVRVSLSPDARQLALQVAEQGRWRVELLDLSDLLEPDRPAGAGLTTPPLEPQR
ncbi:hypothetical protein SynA15127_02462 [Synechococcus sp. A15-127]|uniref:hypothetical protein n=1 Tax=Synechococcus sp. A15-127 TaxID=1050624 RepID=UPI0016462DFE|nr:hypothetical protein SynA15127_02462 [Synechococcus sp. A15-127]